MIRLKGGIISTKHPLVYATDTGVLYVVYKKVKYKWYKKKISDK
jgi:hypothetical protein